MVNQSLKVFDRFAAAALSVPYAEQLIPMVTSHSRSTSDTVYSNHTLARARTYTRTHACMCVRDLGEPKHSRRAQHTYHVCTAHMCSQYNAFTHPQSKLCV